MCHGAMTVRCSTLHHWTWNTLWDSPNNFGDDGTNANYNWACILSSVITFSHWVTVQGPEWAVAGLWSVASRATLKHQQPLARGSSSAGQEGPSPYCVEPRFTFSSEGTSLFCFLCSLKLKLGEQLVHKLALTERLMCRPQRILQIWGRRS